MGVIFLGVTFFTGVGVTGVFAFVAHCMLSATISVLGIEVHAGIRGAERSFCASFFCGVIGLVHFCHSFTIGDFSIGWFTLKFLAQDAFPDGSGSNHATLTIDSPPLLFISPETPRLTFF